MTLTHRSAQHLPLAEMGSSLNGDYQAIIRKTWPWATSGNLVGECHAPFEQNGSYVDVEEE